LKRLLRVIGSVLLTAIALVVLLVAGRLVFTKPSTERDWIPEHRIGIEARFEGDRVHLANIRNYRYASTGEAEESYYARTFDLNAIESVWFIVSPFKPDWRGPAHSFLSFGFADSQYVAISVEARKEVGEGYSVWKGALNTYELFYVVVDERDAIGRRVFNYEDDVYVYPLNAPKDRARKLFIAMLERAAALQETPEFYNTLTSNCTTNLYEHARALNPGKWSYSWKLQLPGYVDELIVENGALAADMTVAEARKRFLVTDRVVQYFDDPNFSVLIRE
jgi:hypothetical protein